MLVIISDNGDDTVGITSPNYAHVGSLVASGDCENESEALNKIALESCGETPYILADESAVPADPYFCAAWKFSEGSIVVDMPRACDIHMDNIRVARDGKFVELDFQYILADENDDTVARSSIVEQKVALRDLPETFILSGATTPEELKALWPPELA